MYAKDVKHESVKVRPSKEYARRDKSVIGS